MTFLLDIDTLAHGLRGEGGVPERWRATRPADLALPAPALFELRSRVLAMARGTRRAAFTLAFDAVVAGVRVVPLDAAAAEAAALARIRIEAAGALIGTIELQTAGIALAQGWTLITRNGRDFSRVDGLKTENWYAEPATR